MRGDLLSAIPHLLALLDDAASTPFAAVREFSDYRIQSECARGLDGLVLDETTPERLRRAALLVLLTALEGPMPDGPNPDSIDRLQWWRERRGRYFP